MKTVAAATGAAVLPKVHALQVALKCGAPSRHVEKRRMQALQTVGRVHRQMVSDR